VFDIMKMLEIFGEISHFLSLSCPESVVTRLNLTLTAKVKILPTDEQKEWLRQTLRAYRTACLFVSKIVFETKDISLKKLHLMTYRELRSTFGLRSQMAQSVMKTVIARYKSLRSNNHPWTQVQFKKPEYDLVWNRDYSRTKQGFSINTLFGRIKVPFEIKGMEAYFDGSWTFGTAKLVHTLFVVEDLTGVRQATERVRIQDRYETVSWSFFQLRKMIEYKALQYGAKVIAVDPRYTSLVCPKCGHTGKANRNKRKHHFCCRECNYSSYDDRIGAMNLQRIGMEYIAEVAV
jgi:IS605 OrfB family transposase